MVFTHREWVGGFFLNQPTTIFFKIESKARDSCVMIDGWTGDKRGRDENETEIDRRREGRRDEEGGREEGDRESG